MLSISVSGLVFAVIFYKFSLPRVSRKIGNYNYNSADGTMQGNVLLYYYNKPTTRFYNGRERW